MRSWFLVPPLDAHGPELGVYELQLEVGAAELTGVVLPEPRDPAMKLRIVRWSTWHRTARQINEHKVNQAPSTQAGEGETCVCVPADRDKEFTCLHNATIGSGAEVCFSG